GVVLEEAVRVRASFAPRPEEPAVLGRERAEQEGRELARRVEQILPVQPPPRLGQRREREPVPRGDHLVVAQRLRPLLAQLEDPRPRLRVELAANDGATVLERL